MNGEGYNASGGAGLPGLPALGGASVAAPASAFSRFDIDKNQNAGAALGAFDGAMPGMIPMNGMGNAENKLHGVSTLY